MRSNTTCKNYIKCFLYFCKKVHNMFKQNKFYHPELDGLRFLAFFLVFMHHHPFLRSVPYLSILNIKGWMGVDLFFTLSAFLFTKLLLLEYEVTKSINYKKFYIRRIFRIWPLYLFYIFLIFVIEYITSDINIFNSNRIFGLLTFTDNIYTAIKGYNPINFTGHLWTIGFEEQFYLIIPFLIYYLSKINIKQQKIIAILFIILLIMARIIFINIETSKQAIYTLPITHFESILFGILIAFGNNIKSISNKINSNIIGLLGIGFFILLNHIPQSLTIKSYWLFAHYSIVGLSSSCLVIAVLESNYLKKFFSNKILVFLGKRSYGLYIYHFIGNHLAFFLIKRYFDTSSLSLSFCLSLLITIIFSIISYKFIEKPFLILKKSYEIIISRPA